MLSWKRLSRAVGYLISALLALAFVTILVAIAFMHFPDTVVVIGSSLFVGLVVSLIYEGITP